MKQTAVKWLIEELKKVHHPTEAMIMYAKKLEKQQIIDAFDEGQEYEYQYHINNAPKFDSETYFAETYGSKGSDEHIVDTNEMIDQVPDVRKMVEWIDKEILLNPYYADSPRLREGANMVKVKLQQYTFTSSQTEISDEEIEEAAKNAWSDYVFDEGNLYYTTFKGGWEYGIKWYREQLKKKQ